MHGFGCSVACGIFLDQGSNPCLLHWQVDSLPLSHQGRPRCNCSCTDFQAAGLISAFTFDAVMSLDATLGYVQ